MRLNQFISSSGHCSRRHADKLIKTGRVTVNGQTEVNFSYPTQVDDRIMVDDELIKGKKRDIYLMLNKPPGITCTAASHIEGNIIDFVNYPERIFPIGRLDKQSEGLILLTNDGSIVNRLLKEENHAEKDYDVTVDKIINDVFIADLACGVEIYNPRKKTYTRTKSCPVIKLSDDEFRITLSQGLNRQIRRMCRRFQYTVTKLKRVRMKHLTLGDLEVGKWRYLTAEEIEGLK